MFWGHCVMAGGYPTASLPSSHQRSGQRDSDLVPGREAYGQKHTAACPGS